MSSDDALVFPTGIQFLHLRWMEDEIVVMDDSNRLYEQCRCGELVPEEVMPAHLMTHPEYNP